MSPKPSTQEEARRWLSKAGDDLRACDVDLAAVPPLIEDALYRCQQACEKTRKGFLVWHSQPFRRTHDIGELATLCVELDASLEASVAPAAPRTEYNSAFRYPGTRDEPSLSEAEEARAIAGHVCDAINTRMSQRPA